MATTEPWSGAPLPEGIDNRNLPAQLLAAMRWTGRQSVPTFSDATARDAAAAALVSSGLPLVRGMLCFINSTGRIEQYSGSGTTWNALIEQRFESDSAAVAGANWDAVSPRRTVRRRVTVPILGGGLGLFNIPLPNPFAKGILWLMMATFDNSIGVVRPVPGGHSLGQLQGQALTPAGAPVESGTNVLISYEVEGWD